MQLAFDNGDRAYINLGYHEVLVVAGKTTIISGLVPLETMYQTIFSSSEGNLKYKATFDIGTAEAHPYHGPYVEERPQKVSLEERPKPELGEIVIHDPIDPNTPVSLKNKPFEPNPKERYIIVNVSFVEKQVETTLNCKLLEEDGETVFIDLEATEKGTYKYKTEERVGSSTYAIPESALPKTNVGVEKNVTIYVIRYDEQDAIKPVFAVSKPIALAFYEEEVLR
jgi:hypothetical protein